MPPQPPQLVKASLKALPGGSPVMVHFNPASLVYTVENSVAQQSGGPKKVQYVAQFSAKLSMDLQFDTTDSGADVRTYTNQVALFMQASANAAAAAANNQTADSSGGNQSAPAKAPPVLMFEWGSYQFQGIMESFKETIDFFSNDGVALRALVSIGLARQDFVFDDSNTLSSTSTLGTLVPSGSGDSALSVATRGGDPSAARQLGSDNGLASLRFTGGASLQVNAGVQLNPPAAFVSAASASSGLSLGISGSAGAGASFSASASAQITAGASGGPVFGGQASAGVSASDGAFAGLETGRAAASSTARLNPNQIVPVTVGTDVSTFAGATFDLGGAASSSGAAGLSANVGAQFSFSDRLRFDSDD
jgi:hypothetical protein